MKRVTITLEFAAPTVARLFEVDHAISEAIRPFEANLIAHCWGGVRPAEAGRESIHCLMCCSCVHCLASHEARGGDCYA